MVRRLVKRLFLLVAVVVVALVVVFATGTLDRVRMPSEAMSPAFAVQEELLVLRHVGGPAVGQVWTVALPAAAEESRCATEPASDTMCAVPLGGRRATTFVQRVVAGPGDRISLRGGRIVRDGTPEAARTLGTCDEPTSCDFPETITVPRGQWFMLGDDRGNSNDSRFWGPVRRSQLDARVLGAAPF